MSHTIKAKSELKDARILERAANRISAVFLGHATHSLYGANTAKGVGVRLRGWEYPLVIDEAGEIAFDDFVYEGGTYGIVEHDENGRGIYRRDHAEIDTLRQAYAIEAAIDAAQSNGWTVSGETIDSETGAVELTVIR